MPRSWRLLLGGGEATCGRARTNARVWRFLLLVPLRESCERHRLDGQGLALQNLSTMAKQYTLLTKRCCRA